MEWNNFMSFLEHRYMCIMYPHKRLWMREMEKIRKEWRKYVNHMISHCEHISSGMMPILNTIQHPVNWTIIDPDNGLLPILRQAIF